MNNPLIKETENLLLRLKREIVTNNDADFLAQLKQAGLRWQSHPPEIHPRNPDAPAFIIPPKTEGHEGWIFKREVNLISGSSGMGKTTIALDVLEQARQGLSVLGHPASTREYRVIMFDRSKEAFERTAQRMKLEPTVRDRIHRPEQRMTLTDAINDYMSDIDVADATGTGMGYPDTLFVEGIDMLVPGGKHGDFDVICRFAEEVAECARYWDVAILGSIGTPKQKSRDRYLLTRDNIFGSVAWGRKSETILHVQLTDDGNPNSVRELVALTRNGQAETYRLRWRYGRLEEAPALDGVEETRAALASHNEYDGLVAAVRALAPGTAINTRCIPGLSQTQASRYLRKLAEQEPTLVGKPAGEWTRLGTENA